MADKYVSAYTGAEIDAAVDRINNILDIFYPVGSIYTTTDANETITTLHSRMGGTWEQIKDTFLLAAGDTYTTGATGGEATHTLTVNEMPSHEHQIANNYNSDEHGGSNTHILSFAGYGTQYYLVSGYGGSNGGDQPHNNMPPYLVVKMFKRTA